MEPQHDFLFPPFRLDPKNGQLWRDQQTLPLKPKTFAVLEHLAVHAGQLVTKDELLGALWADVHVGDAVLKTCIREIRQALEDDPQTPRFIETVHRRGYRFIGQVVSSQPSVVTRRTAVRGPYSATDARSLKTRLVGREVELYSLHDWLEKARRGERQMVFVSGEAGIGKTALVDAFLEQLTAQDNVWVARGQCWEQYGAGEAYLPILTAFGQLCRESEGEQVKAVLQSCAPTWLMQLPALLSPPELDTLQSRVAGVTRKRMLREMAEAIEALTLDRAVLLWLDDLQWSDYSTLDLLSAVARRSHPARLLVVGAYRPVDVIVQDHPLRLVKQDLQLHGQCEELALELLTETAVQDYFALRFTDQAKPDAALQSLARLIHHRTQGNPLFVVSVADELVRQEVIIERQGQWKVVQKVEEVKVPAGIRQFIEQQVEQLSVDFQQVLEAASVAGMEFSAAAVAAGIDVEVEEVEAWCEALARRRQFIQTDGSSEWPDGTVAARYRFIHALYQQVVYERAPAGRCASLHRRIGERLEIAYGSHTSELAAELAVHFERGRDYQRAVQYLEYAGKNALARSAYVEATDLLTRGLEVLQVLPETLERARRELSIQLPLGAALMTTRGYGAAEVERAYTRALTLCQRGNGTPELFRTLKGLWNAYFARGNLRGARALAKELLTHAQQRSNTPLLFSAYAELGETFFHLGELPLAVPYLQQAVTTDDNGISSSRTRQDPRIASYASWALWISGYPDQALQKNTEAITLARGLAHPHNLAFALGFSGFFHLFRCEVERVCARAEEESSFCREHGFPYWLPWGVMLHGWVLNRQGLVDEGIQQMRQGIVAYRTTGAEVGLVHFLTVLSEMYAAGGQFAEATTIISEALTMMQRNDNRYWEAEVYRLKGELLHKAKKDKQLTVSLDGEAEECFLKAIEVAQRQRAKSLELRATMSLVQLRRQQREQARTRAAQHAAHDKLNGARRMLSKIYYWFTEGFDTKDLREARALLND